MVNGAVRNAAICSCLGSFLPTLPMMTLQVPRNVPFSLHPFSCLWRMEKSYSCSWSQGISEQVSTYMQKLFLGKFFFFFAKKADVILIGIPRIREVSLIRKFNEQSRENHFPSAWWCSEGSSIRWLIQLLLNVDTESRLSLVWRVAPATI